MTRYLRRCVVSNTTWVYQRASTAPPPIVNLVELVAALPSKSTPTIHVHSHSKFAAFTQPPVQTIYRLGRKFASIPSAHWTQLKSFFPNNPSQAIPLPAPSTNAAHDTNHTLCQPLDLTMDDILSKLLSFPPHPPPITPLSDQQYDEGIREQIEAVKRISDAKLLQETSGGEHVLDVCLRSSWC